jgi:drug/metabolite transporter (DMT)-like permease
VTGDLALLGLAVAAVSTSGPLIRYAAAPALAIAFWRNALALPVLGTWIVARQDERAAWGVRSLTERRRSALAGLLLAAHFAFWVPSLSYTTVASSVALVATQPVWAALISRVRGEPVPPGTWPGISLALVGVVLLTAADLSISGRALFGDLLALAGGILAAAYVTVGSVVRRAVTTAAYATTCYAVAAGVLLVVCLASGQELWGYDARTWFALAGLVLGAQLLGHTVINRVLRTLSPTVVSVGILGEIVGSTLLAWLWFEEVPSAALWPAAALIAAGVVVVVRGMRVPPAPPPAV